MISLISVAHASTAKATAQGFVDNINEFILFPIIALLMAIAFIVFLYGAFNFVKNANNEAARETGRNSLIYGVIGMLVMLSAFSILSIAANTFGLGTQLDEAGNTSTNGTFGTAGENTNRGPTGGAVSSADRLSSALNGNSNTDESSVSSVSGIKPLIFNGVTLDPSVVYTINDPAMQDIGLEEGPNHGDRGRITAVYVDEGALSFRFGGDTVSTGSSARDVQVDLTLESGQVLTTPCGLIVPILPEC